MIEKKEPIRPITWIIVGIAVIFILGYFSFQLYQRQKIESGKENREQQDLLLKQQEELEKTKKDIEALKETIGGQKQKNNNEAPINTDSNKITASDLKDYLSDIGEITCYGTNYAAGSGSIWKNLGSTNGLWVLTNNHVITTNKCTISIPSSNYPGTNVGSYSLDVNNVMSWNNKTDVAVLRITGLYFETSKPLNQIQNYLSNLKLCNNQMPVGSPVIVVGYPSFAEIQYEEGTQSTQATTEGIISGFDNSVKTPIGSLPEVDYFVSAKIDSGNSGGLAFSKDSNGLCILGIPTWVSLGNYETQGVVQNIHNIFYKE